MDLHAVETSSVEVLSTADMVNKRQSVNFYEYIRVCESFYDAGYIFLGGRSRLFIFGTKEFNCTRALLISTR